MRYTVAGNAETRRGKSGAGSGLTRGESVTRQGVIFWSLIVLVALVVGYVLGGVVSGQTTMFGRLFIAGSLALLAVVIGVVMWVAK